MNYKKQNAPFFWFLVVAASLRVHDCKYKQNMTMSINSGMEKKNISLKCFSILAFKSRQKIHSSLKDDERQNRGPTTIHTEDNFTYYTSEVKTVNKYDIVLPSSIL